MLPESIFHLCHVCCFEPYLEIWLARAVWWVSTLQNGVRLRMRIVHRQAQYVRCMAGMRACTICAVMHGMRERLVQQLRALQCWRRLQLHFCAIRGCAMTCPKVVQQVQVRNPCSKVCVFHMERCTCLTCNVVIVWPV